MSNQLILKSSKIPTLYAAKSGDPIVHVKLFTPCSGWTWLLTEYDLSQDLAFGFCYNSQDPQGAELGYVSLAELRPLKTRFGTPAVERDQWFKPQPLSAAKLAECPHA